MDTAVVELDPLADPVRAAAEDHHFAVVRRRDFVGCVVGRVIVRGVFDTADGNGIPALDDTQAGASLADLLLGQAQDLGEVAVGKAVLFGLYEKLVGKFLALVFQHLFLEFDEFLHLFDEPVLDIGLSEELIDAGSFSQSLIHDELSFARRFGEKIHQFLEAFLVEIAGKAEAVSAFLQ